MRIARGVGRLVLGVSILSACGCGDDVRNVHTGDFVALTYNVAGLPEGISGSHPAVNTAQIGPRLNPFDLVLLQESWLTPDPNPLAPLRTYHEILQSLATQPYLSEPLPAPLNQNPERPSAIVSDGLNRFSNFPFATVIRQRWFGCDDSAADCLSLKGFSAARTEVAPGVCVDVYNLHGEAGHTEHDLELKAMNARDLVAFIQSYSAGRAVIVGGDFNMHLSREEEAADLAYISEQGQLTDACIALGILDEDEIDKFFFRSNDAVTLTPTSCRILADSFVDANGEPLSDHDPLEVAFAWQAHGPGEDCF